MSGLPLLAAGHMLHIWHVSAICLTCAIYLIKSHVMMWLLPTWSRFPVVTAEWPLPSAFLPWCFISALFPAAFFGGYWPLIITVFPWAGIKCNVGGFVLHQLVPILFLWQLLYLVLPQLSTFCLCLFGSLVTDVLIWWEWHCHVLATFCCLVLFHQWCEWDI